MVPKGQQCLIPSYGKHQGVEFIGTPYYETGVIFCVEEEKYDAEVFPDFLKKTLTDYPTGTIVMILDNARIHHARRIQPFLAGYKNRLELVFLPPYSPQ